MTPADLFYYTSAFALILFIAVFLYLTYRFIILLRLLQEILENIKGTTRELETVKQGLKVGGLTLLSKILGKPKERG